MFGNYMATLAIDGNHNPRLASGSCAHPAGDDNAGPAWWRVDLGATYVILSVNITNRGDCCGGELGNCLAIKNAHKIEYKNLCNNF